MNVEYCVLCFWVLNLVAGVVAPVLLLLRQKIAVWFALISAVSDLILIFITFAFMNRWNAIGGQTAVFDIEIAFLTFTEFVYCLWYFKRET